MSSFYSNLAKEKTLKIETNKNKSEKCYSAKKKLKKPNFNKAVIAGG
jgi:hypothetical protein